MIRIGGLGSIGIRRLGKYLDEMAEAPRSVSRATARRSPEWLSDQLLEPTKLVFAVVIAESLRDYEDVLRRPIHPTHYIATLALIGIYGTTIWSWLGWHRAHERYPYRIAASGIERRAERWRFYADLAIVIAYAYTLAQVRPTVDHPAENIAWLLAGYPLIVALYGFENWLRRTTYGFRVRRTVPLLVAFGLFCTLAASYVLARRLVASGRHVALNAVALCLVVVFMWTYRLLNDAYKAKYVDRFTVGVDLDGVIADQVRDVLPRIEERWGVELEYDDLTEFRLRVGDSDLASEIKAAQRQRAYLEQMAALPDARDALATIKKHARLMIITARPRSTRVATRRWLAAQGLAHDGLINARELTKSRYGTDVLIDDYTENVREFLDRSDGLGVLVDRPWNRSDRERLDLWRGSGRLRIVGDLSEAAAVVEEYRLTLAANNLAEAGDGVVEAPRFAES